VTYPTLIVLVGTTLLGSTAGVLGSFAVLRRRALVGDLLSHAALPGLCLAFLVLGRSFSGMVVGALLAGLVGIGMMTLVCRFTRTKEDAALGIVLSTFFAAGVVLLSVIQKQTGGGSRAGLESYIFGQAAGMNLRDVWMIAGLSLGSLLLVMLLYKEMKLLSFDPGFARAQGWPVFLLDMAMMGALCVVTVVGLPAVGILMVAILIIPAATARFWTERLGAMLVLAAAAGGLAGAVGTLLSAGLLQEWVGFDPLAFGDRTKNLPTGPLIVLCATAVFLASLLLAPRRGIVARAAAELRLRAKTAREHLLRTLFELSEPHLPERPVVTLEQLLAQRAWSRAWARWLVWWGQRRGSVERAGGGVRLTEAGLDRATKLVRAHRLWELFLIRGANIAPDHVDRDADAIEHLLTPELVAELEAQLEPAAVAELPGGVPESPHEISPHQTSPHDEERPA